MEEWEDQQGESVKETFIDPAVCHSVHQGVLRGFESTLVEKILVR